MQAQARFERERGRVEIDRAAAVRIALAFPNTYSVGMASLGFHLVHRMLNELPDASCERVFLPDPADLDEHVRTRTELFTVESRSPLSDFDVVAFSVSWELDYLNILRMLDLANLPVLRRDRDESRPLVIAGGACATFNPEPLADFVDAFVIGDAEDVLPALVSALASTQGRPRETVLKSLASVASVYVPGLYEPVYDSDRILIKLAHDSAAPERVTRAACRDLAAYPSSSCISTGEGEFGDITLVEVARGCGRGCRFCVAGHINRPPRARGFVIPNTVRNLLSGQGEDRTPHAAQNHGMERTRLGLVSASVFDHPGSLDLCRRIIEAGGEFTVSSLRLETVTHEVAELLSRGGQRTLTIAPEAGSERLRRVINKHCMDDRIVDAVACAQEAGFERVKLYFMIGLPTETDADIESIIGLVRRLAEAFPSVRFHASTSAFVPKPWTEFQWHPMEAESVLKRRFACLSKGIGSIRGAAYSGESPRLAVVQGLLARGDRRTGAMLARALTGGGYPAAIRESGIDVAWYLRRQLGRDEVLPWDHIDAGIDKRVLWSEYQKAIAE